MSQKLVNSAELRSQKEFFSEKEFYAACCVCCSVLRSYNGLELHAQVALRVSGATTIQPAAELVAESFARSYSGSADVQGGGSGAGIRLVRNGTADIDMVSRALTTEELSDLEAVTYGFDALVFIVNRANPLEELRLSDVRQIYSGAATNWGSLSGWDNDIVVINKEIGRATLDLFEGYSGVSHRDRAASAETLGNGNYPILRELNLVVREETELSRSFTDLFFEPEVRSYIEASGVVPADL
ncbi:MAG: substrate-binding domain-containing protein [Spirochaeta sp.]|nr:substrate-binding domain-containing protein [Spirochaeta sp.]